jgi:hypothetical protein
MWRTPVIVASLFWAPTWVEVCQWTNLKVLGVLREYQLAYIPANAYDYCREVVQPSVVRRINGHSVIRHHTEKMNVLSLECSTFITIEVAARGECGNHLGVDLLQ